MIYLGKEQDLIVEKIVDVGAYLSSETKPSTVQYNEDTSVLKEERILLPKKEIPENTNLGDKVHVFVYKDTDDRPIASTFVPSLTLGTYALLKVAAVTDIGAFLSWGLLKDLLLPYREQTYNLAEGNEVLVALYIDKSRRLCATMKVYDYLSTDSSYKKDDMVTAWVYEIIKAFGAFAAVDNKYSALIPNNELFGKEVTLGSMIEARVSGIHEDGKINLSIREKTHIQMDIDANVVMTALNEAKDGFLPYHDKSSPDDIKTAFNISKNSFKRAIGRLMKNGSIDIKEDGIYLK